MAGPVTYVGVSSKARKVDKIYVGVSGTARKVTKVYAGVGGVAKLVFTSDWWWPAGVSLANCVAAYRFKGAASATAALNDLTGHGYTLSSQNLAWTSANGYYKDSSGNAWLNCTSLKGKDIRSYVFRYDQYSASTGGRFIRFKGSSYPVHFSLYSGQVGTNNTGTSSAYWNPPCFFYELADTHIITPSSSSAAAPTTGVYGASVPDKKMYLNGNAVTTKQSYHDNAQAINYVNDGDQITFWWPGTNFRLYAAVFFSVSLTAAQQKDVYNGMMTL